MSTVTTIGSSIINPDLTRAISDMASKARKQLADTGSLTGFSDEYTGESGGETVTISMKAMAMSSYDKSASPDDTLLAFSVKETDALGSASGAGSSGTIKADQDIDATAKSFQGLLVAETTPYTSISYDASDYAPGGVLAGYAPEGTPAGSTNDPKSATAAPTAANPNDSAFVVALQQKYDATTRLVSALQESLDGSKSSTSNSVSSRLPDQNDIGSMLKSLLLPVDIKV